MKVLVITDIHSNIHSLEAIWDRENDSDIVYCAGDLVDYGPRPKEVIDWIRERGAICVRGNHDTEVISCYRDCDLERLPVEETRWQHHNAMRLSEEDIIFLERLPACVDFKADGNKYGMAHLYRELEVITNPHAFDIFVKEMSSGNQGGLPTRLIFGHTHRLSVTYLDDTKLWMNAGSVSYRGQRDIPSDPSQDAQYITIVDGEIQIKRVVYDVTSVYGEMKKQSVMDSEMETAIRLFGPR